MQPSFGVYVHVPFCARRCDYCAFAAWEGQDALAERYMAACLIDARRLVDAGMPQPSSVFVGGGTPSRVDPEALGRIFSVVGVDGSCEVTVECNPEDVTPRLLDGLAAAGANRISLGVQSMEAAVLRSLGRWHDPSTVEGAVGHVKAAGFHSFNLDLIYGAAGETDADWRRSLEAVLALEPPHVSAYALTVEPGTPLADDLARHPDDDDQADKYLLTEQTLPDAGLEWYEISNWARPGHDCRHNELYWTMGEYQAVGCAGHSHRDQTRFWNVRTPERYIEAMEAARDPVAGSERLDADARRLEALQLALRTRAGVPPETLPLEELVGLVDVVDGRAVLTVDGRLLANEVALRLR